MSKRAGYSPRLQVRGAAHVFSILAMSFGLLTLLLGGGGGTVVRQVGGVMVDAKGVVSIAPVEVRERFVEEVKADAGSADAAIAELTEMRMVSLKNLNAEIKKAVDGHRDDLPPAVKYLAGIQRIEHVFLYPGDEGNDIVLAGPGEGWVVDDQGNVVGETTGQPVVHLADLVTAMRSEKNAGDPGITCSIDPTHQGQVRFNKFLKTAKKTGFNDRTIAAARTALGPQTISVTGVPENSRFAQVMVVADYQMKRIAMHLDETPVAAIPSYLDLLKAHKSRPTSVTPRWWLACNYEPLSKSADGLAWHINGPGVKAMTEDSFLKADGTRESTGKASPIAQEWSDNMTRNYAELSTKMPIFGDLRNLMDLSVVAALIEKEKMLDQVGLKVPMLNSDRSAGLFSTYEPPKTVDTVCSYMRIPKGTVLTASGGVQVDSLEVVSHVQEDAKLSEVREAANPHGMAAWFWN